MVAMPNLPTLALPIIAAPMAGGPSRPELVAAVAAIGGSGFLAAGYRTAGQMHDQIKSTRALTDAPFGVNLFVPNDDPVDDSAIGDYRQALAATAAEYGLTDLALPNTDCPDTDDWDAKIAVLQSDPVPMVSFTFGLPAPTSSGRCRPSAVASSLPSRAWTRLRLRDLSVTTHSWSKARRRAAIVGLTAP